MWRLLWRHKWCPNLASKRKFRKEMVKIWHQFSVQNHDFWWKSHLNGIKRRIRLHLIKDIQTSRQITMYMVKLYGFKNISLLVVIIKISLKNSSYALLISRTNALRTKPKASNDVVYLLSHITQHFHAFLISYANILTCLKCSAVQAYFGWAKPCSCS